MRAPLRLRGALSLVLLALLPGFVPAGAAPSGDVEILIESPAVGETVSARVHQARVSGSALADSEGPTTFDVMLAIDISLSTTAASGVDVDGDGVVGLNPRLELLPPGTYPPDVLSTDPQDTILHAEIMAAHALLGSLDPRRVRVGVLTFAGEVDPATGLRKRMDQADAWLEVPLTNDYDRVRDGLVAILARGAHGATNFAAGIRLGIRELASLSGARSAPRPEAKKVMLFLTDGVPTLPIDRGSVSDPGDVEAAVRSARVAQKAGITINTYALGPGALTYPQGLTEMARVSLGTYTPVQNPGDIILLLQGTTFANIEDVVLTNLSTGEFSTDVWLNPDGSFYGYVPVKEGRNRVRVSALATDGKRGTLEFDFDFRSEGLSDREKELELDRLRRITKELMLKREAERIRSFREQQRKELEVTPATE